jgi:hypothetical protein
MVLGTSSTLLSLAGALCEYAHYVSLYDPNPPVIVMDRRLGVVLQSADMDVVSVRKALTAGLLMNAVQLVETTHDISDPSSSGINVYRIIRSTGPGLRHCPTPSPFFSC